MKSCIYCKNSLPLSEFTTVTVKQKKYLSCSCKKCEVIRQKRVRREIKRQMVELAGGKCIQCGYDKCLGALDFHHRDGNDKSFVLNRATSLSQKVLDELAKCDLVCSNCHREIHFNE